MGIKSRVLDPYDLQQTEEACRFLLRHEPDNMETRVDLAWCLFFQALSLWSRETKVAALKMTSEKALVVVQKRLHYLGFDTRMEAPNSFLGENLSQALASKFAQDPKTDHLLQECLHHSLMVRHLSANTSHRLDAETLEALILLAGGKKLLLSSEKRGIRIKSQLFRVFCEAPDQESC